MSGARGRVNSGILLADSVLSSTIRTESKNLKLRIEVDYFNTRNKLLAIIFFFKNEN